MIAMSTMEMVAVMALPPTIAQGYPPKAQELEILTALARPPELDSLGAVMTLDEARGERERRLGRIPDAAADFNRALALRPNDAAILKRVTKLSSQTMWAE